MNPIIERLNQNQINKIENLEKERQKRRELEKAIDNNLSKAIETNFPDDKEISKYLKGKRFDINGEDYTKLRNYLESKKNSNKLYNDLSIDLQKFQQEVNNLSLVKTEQLTKALKSETQEANKELVANTYQEIWFLADNNNRIDDFDIDTKFKHIKNANAAVYGGDIHLAAQLLQAKSRRGEELFVSKTYDIINNYLEKKGVSNDNLVKIENYTLNTLKEQFENKNNKIKVKYFDGKKEKEKNLSLFEIYHDAIANGDINELYFGNGEKRNLERGQINLENDSDKKILFDRYLYQNSEKFAEEYNKWSKSIDEDIKKNTEKTKSSIKTIEKQLNKIYEIEKNGYVLSVDEQKQKENLENELEKGKAVIKDKNIEEAKRAIYLNGIYAAFVKSDAIHRITEIAKTTKYTNEKTPDGVTTQPVIKPDRDQPKDKISIIDSHLESDIYSAGASFSKELVGNLSAIIGMGITHINNQKITIIDRQTGKTSENKDLQDNTIITLSSGLSQGISKNLSTSLIGNMNIVDFFKNGANFGATLGLNGNVDITDGSKRGGAAWNVYGGVGVDVLSGSVGGYAGLDRDKVRGIRNFVDNLNKGLRFAISNELSDKKISDKQTFIDNISNVLSIDDKDNNQKIKLGKKKMKAFGLLDKDLSKSIAADIYNFVSNYEAQTFDTTTIKGNAELDKAVQTHIVDAIMANIATKKYQSTNKFSWGGISFSRSDIATIIGSGVAAPFTGGLSLTAAGAKMIANNTKLQNIKGEHSIKVEMVNGGKNRSLEQVDLDKLNSSFGLVEKNIHFVDSENGKYISIPSELLSRKGIYTNIEGHDNSKDLLIDANDIIDIYPHNTIYGATMINISEGKSETKIEKREYTHNAEIKINLESSSEFKKQFEKVRDKDGKKTLEGQQLATRLRSTPSYKAFSNAMDKGDYSTAVAKANDILKEAKLSGYTFDVNKKNDLMNFWVMLIDWYYTEGKIGTDNEEYKNNINSLTSQLDNNKKAIVEEILTLDNKSLYQITLKNGQNALSWIKSNLMKTNRDLYIKLLTIGDITTQNVFVREKDNKIITSRADQLTGIYGKEMSDKLKKYTNESLQKVGHLRNYQTEIAPLGFVMGYPGEKLAENLEIVSGSQIDIPKEDKQMRTFAYEKAISKNPEYMIAINKILVDNDQKAIDKIDYANIDKNGNLVINDNVYISSDALKLGLYAHCNGNHSILAPGLKINIKGIKEENTTTKIGGLNIQLLDNKGNIIGGNSINITAAAGQVVRKSIETKVIETDEITTEIIVYKDDISTLPTVTPTEGPDAGKTYIQTVVNGKTYITEVIIENGKVTIVPNSIKEITNIVKTGNRTVIVYQSGRPAHIPVEVKDIVTGNTTQVIVDSTKPTPTKADEQINTIAKGTITMKDGSKISISNTNSNITNILSQYRKFKKNNKNNPELNFEKFLEDNK